MPLGGFTREMLSIGKLGVGQATYYLDQAHGRVDRVGGVSSGAEDYYLEGPEPGGVWIGAGGGAIGLTGRVREVELRNVLAGLHPVTGMPLRGSRVRVPGFDLTFSAPKSVSVLFGIGDDAMRAAVRRAHDRAVADGLGYLERAAAKVRRGAGGATVLPAAGLVGAAFMHRTSRAGDPQLHTHVLLANLALGPDGRWSALDARWLYAHARTASFLYQARLRAELTRSLGVSWTPVRAGIAEVEGVGASVLREFSRRRIEIEAALERQGTTSARAAQVAALETRRRKDRSISPAALVPEWRSRAAEHGLVPEAISRLLGRRGTAEVDRPTWERFATELASRAGLTREHSSFTRRDVIRELCDRLPAGAAVDARSFEAAADRFLASDRVVPLMSGAGLEANAPSDERRYSTHELMAIEQGLVTKVLAGRLASAGLAVQAEVETALATRPELADEQRRMVRRLTLGGEAVAVVVGKAGSGKTSALAAACEAWSVSGLPVLGVAVARRAAQELEDAAGIPTTSVSAMLGRLHESGPAALPRRAVLVVDEAGMVPTRAVAQLVEHVARVQGKVVLVGDHRQLPEIEAGGAFRGLVQRGLAIELEVNRRQSAAWEREAVEDLRCGRAAQAVNRYAEHGRLVVEADPDAARERLVADWWAAGDREGSVMLALRRADVEDLNARARERMQSAGAFGSQVLKLPGGSFAVGDRVLVRRNDLRLCVHNGDRATVTGIDVAACRIELEHRGRRVVLERHFLKAPTRDGGPALSHGYALTGHAAQGLTAKRAFVLANGPLTREWGYTALTRGQEANRLYLAATEPRARDEYAPAETSPRDPIESLISALSRSGSEPLAIDVARDGDATDLTQEARRLAGALVRAGEECRDAEQAYRVAVGQRERVERHPLRALLRRRLTTARAVEESAGRRVVRLRHEEDALRQQRHSLGRKLASTVEPRSIVDGDALRERTLARVQARSSGLGREL